MQINLIRIVIALALALCFAAPALADEGAGAFEIPLEDSPFIGHRSAPITIIEFIDYECPKCAEAGKTMRRLLMEYEGKVRLVLKMYPYEHRVYAMRAAEALYAAADQGYVQEMHDLLIDNSPRLDRDSLLQYAMRVGLDMPRFIRALDSMKHISQIERDILFGLEMDIYFAPVFFINGTKHLGPKSYEYFHDVVEAELLRLENQ